MNNQLSTAETKLLIEYLGEASEMYCWCKNPDFQEHTDFDTLVCCNRIGKHETCFGFPPPDFANSRDAIHPVVMKLCDEDNITELNDALMREFRKNWINKIDATHFLFTAPPDVITRACVATIKEIKGEEK